MPVANGVLPPGSRACEARFRRNHIVVAEPADQLQAEYV
jgi:hypothetical protein